jgi:hypothetical protein
MISLQIIIYNILFFSAIFAFGKFIETLMWKAMKEGRKNVGYDTKHGQ